MQSPRLDSEPISVVILAGGRGNRLGRDKASIELGEETLLQRVVRLASSLSDDVVVVVRADQGLQVAGARVVTDLAPFEGVMAGIAAGLRAASREWSFVTALDMPFLNLELIRNMALARLEHDAVVPRLNVGLEPLHALYHKRCLPALHAALEKGRRRVVSFYGSVRVRYLGPAEIASLDPEGRSFFNINTPEDLIRAQAWIDGARSST